MLQKFKEEREKRKAAGPTAAPSVSGAPAAPANGPARSGSGGDYRSSRGGEEFRDRDRSDRDRGYERHSSSRYE